MFHFSRFLALAGLTATLLAPGACRPPLGSFALSPHGHGAEGRGPSPRPVAWRANALAAPCALHCRTSTGRDIACACSGVDSIYFSRLDPGWRLGMATGTDEVDSSPPATLRSVERAR